MFRHSALKADENFLLLRFRYTDAMIFDHDFSLTQMFSDGYLNRLPITVLERIGEQIRDCLFDAKFIKYSFDMFFSTNLNFMAVFFRFVKNPLDTISDSFCQI